MGSSGIADRSTALGVSGVTTNINPKRRTDSKRVPGTATPPSPVLMSIERSHHKYHWGR